MGEREDNRDRLLQHKKAKNLVKEKKKLRKEQRGIRIEEEFSKKNGIKEKAAENSDTKEGKKQTRIPLITTK
mgnify:FL=1